MWRLLRCKADAVEPAQAPEQAPEQPVAGGEDAAPAIPPPAPEAAAPAAEEEQQVPAVFELPPEQEPAPADPEPKMPQKPSAAELEEAKEELVQEIVNKVLEIDGAVVQQISTAPYDPRFPSTNQNRHCFIRYNEFYKCAFERGSDDTRCQFYKNAYESLCPPDWVEEWEELRSQGLWYGKY